jgi:hypothetical protein
MSLVTFFPFLFPGYVWKVLVFFFKGLAKFGSEYIRSWAHLCMETITASISLHVIWLFRCLIFSWFNFGWLYTSRNLSISSKFFSLLDYKFSKYSPMILQILLIFMVMSLFHFWFLLSLIFWVFSLLYFVMLAKGFVNLVNLFKENWSQHWSLLFLSYCCFFSWSLKCIIRLFICEGSVFF